MNNCEKAKIAEVCSTPFGYATFVQCESKTFVIYMDKCSGAALANSLTKVESPRPLTHEFMCSMLDGLECKIECVVVTGADAGTFFAAVKIKMDNEIGSKIVDIDGRPSDLFSLALRMNAPIYVSNKVLESVNDASKLLMQIKPQ